MKKLAIVLSVLFLMILGVESVYSQATATASSTATIITPITISKTVDLNFGNIAVSASTAGTVVLAPAGTRTATGGVTLPVSAGTVSAASFTVGGDGDRTFSITLPSGNITLSRTGGGTMTMGTFTSTPISAGTLTGGTATVTVGGTLNVSAAQTPGIYTNASDLAVTVNYN